MGLVRLFSRLELVARWRGLEFTMKSAFFVMKSYNSSNVKWEEFYDDISNHLPAFLFIMVVRLYTYIYIFLNAGNKWLIARDVAGFWAVFVRDLREIVGER